MKLPYIQFYTGDWKKDPRLSLCSPATRAIWLDLICSLHDDQVCQITGTAEQLARSCRCTPVEMVNAINELQVTQAADITQRDGLYTITCRRMKKAFELSRKRSDAAKQRQSKPQAKPKQNPEADNESDNDSGSDSGGGVQRGAGCVDRPSRSQVEAYAAAIGLGPWKALDWWDEMESVGWLDYRSRAVVAWQPMLNRVKAKWEADGRPAGPPQSRCYQTAGPNGRPLSVLDLQTVLKNKETLAVSLKNKHCVEGPLGNAWGDPKAYEQFRSLRKEIKELTQRISAMA